MTRHARRGPLETSIQSNHLQQSHKRNFRIFYTCDTHIIAQAGGIGLLPVLPIRDAFSSVDPTGGNEYIIIDAIASMCSRSNFFTYADVPELLLGQPTLIGGGISKLEEIRVLLNRHADRILVNTALFSSDLSFLRQASLEFGSQSIVPFLDIIIDTHGRPSLSYRGASEILPVDLEGHINKIAMLGFPEIVIRHSNVQGTMMPFSRTLLKACLQYWPRNIITTGGTSPLLVPEACINYQGHASSTLSLRTLHK